MTYTQEITLELNSNSAPLIINAKQSDVDSRILTVHFTQDGEEYLINSNNFVALRVRKPDSHLVFNDCKINENGTVTATLTYQCLIVAGRAYADLVEFNASGQMLSTTPFIINIVASPDVIGAEALSSNEFLYLKSYVDRGNQEIAKAQAWATGMSGDQPVAPTDIQYQNNAKYYAESVGEVIAEARAAAKEQAEISEAWAVGTKDGEAVPSSDTQYDNNAKYYAQQAKDSQVNVEQMVLETVTLPAGSSAKVENNTVPGGPVRLQFQIPQGEKGDANFVLFDIDYKSGQLQLIKTNDNLTGVDFGVDSDGWLYVQVEGDD